MSGHGVTRGPVAQRRPESIVEGIAPRVEALKEAWRTRPERLWMGLVAVPLAEIATGLLNLWWTWPVLLLTAWACMRSWKWLWLLSLELGIVGVMWAAVGVTALAHFPNDRVQVGAIWAAFPLLLSGAGAFDRHRRNRPEAYFPLR
jgi:hypothetical protein